jgi:hypothetical protein
MQSGTQKHTHTQRLEKFGKFGKERKNGKVMMMG